MSIPSIPRPQQLVSTSTISPNPAYHDLKIVRCQTDPDAASTYQAGGFQFQHQFEEYTMLRATVGRKGVVGGGHERIVAVVHLPLQQFADIVQYDPANPPPHDYHANEMAEAHKRTQADFKGAKARNRDDFRNYLLEGIEGERTLYLPTISGWQPTTVFEKTVFVAFDETDPDAMYGMLFLPKAPIMQADGQTQTAALFAAANSEEASESNCFSNLRVTLEIEFNMTEARAGQSFADRNGRGSKKNKNLVIALDTSALSQLRAHACQDTIFEGRLADGRNTSCTVTSISNIVDLSTMEQMILLVACGGTKKPEHFKNFHVQHFLPFVQDFLRMLEEVFGGEWPNETPPDQDTYRRRFVHGWAFALKAMASAYHQVRIGELGPLGAAIGAKKPEMTAEEAFDTTVAELGDDSTFDSPVTLEEFKSRLQRIDWTRHRRHWIEITGASEKNGELLTVTLKNGEVVVKAQAPNTAAVIGKVADRILSNQWEQLCSSEDAQVPAGDELVTD